MHRRSGITTLPPRFGRITEKPGLPRRYMRRVSLDSRQATDLGGYPPVYYVYVAERENARDGYVYVAGSMGRPAALPPLRREPERSRDQRAAVDSAEGSTSTLWTPASDV